MEPHVLDGGFATQLSRRVDGPVDGTPLWSASFLATDPQACLNTHLDFLQAGANVISTNSYQATVDGFIEHLGLSPEESVQLIHKSVQLAKDARERFMKERNWSAGSESGGPRIAGSIGPYGAFLHDGSEYTGAYAAHMTAEQLMDWHRPRVAALLEAGVDLLAVDTTPARVEGEALVRLLREHPNAKAWLSFSCKDNKHISNGETLAEAVQACLKLDSSNQLVAVGCNCLPPSFVTPLLHSIRKFNTLKDVPLIVYPNSGEVYSVEAGWGPGLPSQSLESHVPEWLDLGAKYVGGCCRTYPPDITRIAEEVNKWKFLKKQQEGQQE